MAQQIEAFRETKFSNGDPNTVVIQHGTTDLLVMFGYPTRFWIDTSRVDKHGRALVHTEQPPQDWNHAQD